MNEKGLMSEKDFSYHLSTFMDYMRKMEKGMSDQWDRFEKFQKTVVGQSRDILNELSKNERLADVGALIEGLKTQFHHDVIGIQYQIGELKEASEDLQNIRRDIKRVHDEALEEMRELIKEFKIVTPEELVKRGALQALEMVTEFKEAYDYIKKVKLTLKNGDLPSFEEVPDMRQKSIVDIFGMKISREGWSARLNNVMDDLIFTHDVKTLGGLASLSRSDILRVRSCGHKTLKEIENILKDYGLKLGMTRK